MSDATNLAKVLVVVGLLVVLTATIPGGSTPPAWTAIQSAINAGVTFPTFIDPFTEGFVAYTLPAENLTLGDDEAVGCDVGSEHKCLWIDDGDSTYTAVNAINTGILFKVTIPLNETRHITSVNINVVCSALGDELRVNGTWRTGSYVPSGDSLQCLKDRYSEYSFAASKVPDATFPAWRWSDVEDGEFGIEYTDASNTSSIRVTQAYLTVWTSEERECEAPPGAWFPWADIVACAIGNAGRFVWKGLMWIVNGISFVLVSLYQALAFISNVIVNFFLGLIEVFISITALGAPSPVQEFLNVSVIAMAGFLVFSIVKIVRGNE